MSSNANTDDLDPANFGRLTLLEVEFDGVNDLSDPGDKVDGLDGASALVLSPDGAYLYVAGSNDNGVAVFECDTDSGSVTYGQLSFLEVEVDGVDDGSDLGGIVDLLELGSYRLFACGSTTLEDLNGTALDGNGDGTGVIHQISRYQDVLGTEDALTLEARFILERHKRFSAVCLV